MSTYPIIQSALNGGEVSEEIARRTDIDKYFSSVSLLRNMYCRPQGGIRNRTGFKFISDATVTEDTIRLIPFSFSTTQAYILEFTIGQMRVYKNKGLVTTTVGGATVPYVVSDNRITKDFINNMYVCQVADILYVAYGGKPITITRYGDTDWRIDYYNHKNGPVGPSVGRGWITKEHNTDTDEDEFFINSEEPQFSSADVDTDIRLRISVKADTIASSGVIDSEAKRSNLKSDVAFAGGSVSVKTTGTWNGVLLIEVSDDGINWREYRAFQSFSDSNYDYTTDFTDSPCLIRLNADNVDTSATGLKVSLTTAQFTYYVDSKILAYVSNVNCQINPSIYLDYVISSQSSTYTTINKGYMSGTLSFIATADSSGFASSQNISSCSIDYGLTGPIIKGHVSFDLYITASFTTAWQLKFLVNYNNSWVVINTTTGRGNYSGNVAFQCPMCSEMRFMYSGSGTERVIVSNFTVRGNQTPLNGSTNLGVLYKGSWGNGVYPTSVSIYQDRLVWGTNYTIDATKTGEYEDFAISSPLLDTDAISTNLRDESVEHINAILGGRGLIAFTETSDFVHSGDVFSPTDFVLQKHGYNGGLAVKPIAQFNRIIYATKTNDIRDLAYNLEDDGYSGENISILAHHLFEGKTVKDMQFQKTPDSLIYFLMTDGTINVLSYLKEQNVIGWSHYDVKDGSIKSIACLHTATGTQTWVAVKRDSSYTVELLSERSEGIYLDCSKKINHITGIDTYIVPHLAGKTVSALVDGNVVHNIEIPASGILPVEFTENIILGYPYDAEVATVPLNHIMRGYPSTQAILKNPVEVHIFYKDSRGGVVKQTSCEEEELIQATPDSIDTHIQPHTGIYKTPLNSIHEEEAKISIMQKDPLPLHITTLAIITDIGG